MSHGLPSQAASVFQRRRRALAASLIGTPGLLFSGVARARNYAANVFGHRPDSHFLYTTGAWLEGAALLVDRGEDTLFLPPSDPGDVIWHGETPSWADIQAATGVDWVRPIDELRSVLDELGRGKVATLPAIDPSTRFMQGSLLDRAWALPGSSVEFGLLDARFADAMIGLRLVHDEAALELMRGAAEGTVAAHRAGMAATRPGLRESDVRAAMEAQLAARDMGCSYGSIVTVHGEILHAHSYANSLHAGDLLLADVGAEHLGWAGDVTRTWPVNGKFSPTQKTMYELVLAMQLGAIDRVRPGARYRDIHLAAARILAQGLVDEGILVGDVDNLVERGATGLFFVHGLGHLLGLDVHDMEDLGDRAGYAPGRTRSKQFGLCYLRLDRDLVPGMAVTIEPGFYQVPAVLAPGSELVAPFEADGTLNRAKLRRFRDVRGIRIEDDVLVTAEGSEVLTSALGKRVDEVEAMVGA
ncbi:aminopeptidase P family protein [Nannocystaceae bacterium ST9]